MKKIFLFLVGIVVLISGCSLNQKFENSTTMTGEAPVTSSSEESQNLPVSMEATVADGYYLYFPKQNEDQGSLGFALELNVRNTGQRNIYISAISWGLKSLETGEISLSKFNKNLSAADEVPTLEGSLKKEQRISGMVSFHLEATAGLYQLLFRQGSEDEWTELDTTIDLSDYEETLVTLGNSENALVSFMNYAIFNETSDNYLAFVANEQNKVYLTYYNLFADMMFGKAGLFTAYQPSEQEKAEIYQHFQQSLREVVAYELTPVYVDPSYAQFTINGNFFDFESFKRIYKEYKKNERDQGNFQGDLVQVEQESIPYLGESIYQTDTRIVENIRIDLKNKCSQWAVDLRNDKFNQIMFDTRY